MQILRPLLIGPVIMFVQNIQRRRIVTLVRSLSLIPVATILTLCFLLFALGCKRGTSPAVDDAGETEITEQLEARTLSASSTEVQVEAEWQESTLPPGYHLRLNLKLDGDFKAPIVGFQNLRLKKALINHSAAQLFPVSSMEQLVRGVWQFRHYNGRGTMPPEECILPVELRVPEFVEHYSDPLQLNRFQGEVDVITTGELTTHTIQDLKQWMQAEASNEAGPLHHVSKAILPSVAEGDFPDWALTFNDNVLVTDAHAVHDDRTVSRQHHPFVDVLPDGRSRVILFAYDKPLPDDLGLSLEIASNLNIHTVEFDVTNILLPERASGRHEKLRVPLTPTTNAISFAESLHAKLRMNHSQFPYEPLIDVGEYNRLETVILEVWGPAAIHTIAIKDLNGKATLGNETQLELLQLNQFPDLNAKAEYWLYDAFLPHDWMGIEGISVPLHYVRAMQQDERLQAISGKLTLMAATAVEYLYIDDALQFIGEKIQHPLLESGQIELKPIRAGNGITITVDEETGLIISEIEAVDESGGISHSIYSSRQQFGIKINFGFYGAEGPVKKLPLIIRLNRGIREIPIQFEFDGIGAVFTM